MVGHKVSMRCLTLNSNFGLVQKPSVFDELQSKHDVICSQGYLLSQLSVSHFETTCYATPAKQNSADGRPSGGLVTYVNSTLRSMFVDSSDCYLAIKVDNVFIYNVFLLTDYPKNTSERLFAPASEKLCRNISSIISSNLVCLIVAELFHLPAFLWLVKFFIIIFTLLIKTKISHIFTIPRPYFNNSYAAISLSLDVFQQKVLFGYLISDHVPASFSFTPNKTSQIHTSHPKTPIHCIYVIGY